MKIQIPHIKSFTSILEEVRTVEISQGVLDKIRGVDIDFQP